MTASLTKFLVLLLAFDFSYGFITPSPPKLPTSSVTVDALTATSGILTKIALASAIALCSATFQPSCSLASTAPAAQAIALEAEGRSLSEVNLEAPPKITEKSSRRAEKIGSRLKALNARMYGSFWCGHCNNQKQELGIQVAKQYDYIECDREGVNSQYQVCRNNNIQGYPTWEVNGVLYPGEKDLGELERLLTLIESDLVK